MTFLTANVNIIRKVEGRNLLFEEVIAANKNDIYYRYFELCVMFMYIYESTHLIEL